jgi:hypothetical protein
MISALYLPFASVVFIWSGALFGCGFVAGAVIHREWVRGS